MEFLGLSGWYVLLPILGIIFLLQYFRMFRVIPVKRSTAGFLAVILLIASAWCGNWGGIRQLGAGAAPSAPTTGVIWSAQGSESDPNLLYDGISRTFSVRVKENTTSQKTMPENVTFTLTVFREDLENTDAVAEVKVVSTPTFRVVGDLNTYSVINKTTEDRWDVAITPAGGSARYERATGKVGPGGSLAFQVVVKFNYTGVSKATDYSSHTLVISAAGTEFYLTVSVDPAVS
jgi:hypothetical protein